MVPRSFWRRWHRRALASALTLACSLTLAFVLGELAPGDAFSALELDPSIPPATLAHLRAVYLPRRSWAARMSSWAHALAHGDLGYSLQFHRPVLSILRERLPASIELVALGLALAWLSAFALAAGPAWAAEAGWRRGAAVVRSFIHGFASLLAALPTGLLAVLALLAAPDSWLAATVASGGSRPLPWLPAVVLMLAFLPGLYFNCAYALAAIGRAGYMVQARAAGIAPFRRLWRHLLPNTSDLLVPVAGLTLSQAMTELVVIETILAWPGIGQLSLGAAAARDMPLLAALVLITSAVVVLTNLASDGLRYALNPALQDASALPHPLGLEGLGR